MYMIIRCDVLLCPVADLTEDEKAIGYPGPVQTRGDVLAHLRNSGPVDGIVWSNKVQCDKEMLDITGTMLLPSVQELIDLQEVLAEYSCRFIL